MNPGGSVKDRAALYIIRDAEERDLITKGFFFFIVLVFSRPRRFFSNRVSLFIRWYGCRRHRRQHWHWFSTHLQSKRFAFVCSQSRRRFAVARGRLFLSPNGDFDFNLSQARGYSCVIFMPDTQSKEKIDLLRNLVRTVCRGIKRRPSRQFHRCFCCQGADVRPVPAVPYDNPQNYNHQAKRYAESLFENWCGSF
jgi:hypothetical protein